MFAGSALCGILTIAAAIEAIKAREPRKRQGMLLFGASSFFLGTIVALYGMGILPPRFVFPLLALYLPLVIWRRRAMKVK